MQINLTDPNPPVKFYFNEDAPDSGYLLLRRVSTAEGQRIRKLCSKKQPPEYKRGQRFELPDKIDEERLAREIWDYSIAGWDGLTDQNGDPIPCTTDMKIKLMQESPDFSAFLVACTERLETDAKNPRDDQTKN